MPRDPSRRRQYCKYCQHFYQKYEHLIRHERTHTGDKPFVCDICRRAFARLDTLGRHKKTHRYALSPKIDNISETPGGEHKPAIASIPAVEDDWKWEQQQEQEQPPESVPTACDSVATDLPVPTIETFASDPIPDPPHTFPFEETEDMLQYLFPTSTSWVVGAMPAIPAASGTMQPSYYDSAIAFTQQPVDETNGRAADDPSPQAMLQLDAMIRDPALTYKNGIKQKGITASFFDVCLSLFFSQFNPTFPIIHEPTWTLKGTSPFVLLTMVSLGSLFVGTDDAREKGDYLWDLTFEAANTRWTYVYEENQVEQTTSTQIVTCAVLGQVYAMLSKSSRLRHIAQTVHGWPFSWARRLGMFDISGFPVQDVPSTSMPLDQKMERWRSWAVHETRRRTMLGLYIVDTQLARYSGGLPIGKHVLNPLGFAAPEAIFQASRVDDWILEMNRSWTRTQEPFRKIYLSIFDGDGPAQMPAPSPISLAALLEGIQAVVSEKNAAGGQAVGVPSTSKISQALLYLHTRCLADPDESVEMLELHIRWHALYLDLITDTVQLFRRLGKTPTTSSSQQQPQQQQKQQQPVFCVGQTPRSTYSDDMTGWPQTLNGRRALLHATAIHDLVDRLPQSRAAALWIPSALFAAATIYCAFCNSGQSEIMIPDEIDWKTVHEEDSDSASVSVPVPSAPIQGWPAESAAAAGRTRLFLHDGEQQQPASSTTRYRMFSLRHCLYQIQVKLGTVSSQWGIAHELRELLNPWTAT